ncbi:MAG: putative rane protein [Marmoricola sp.]|nr:putative rane protein [Marmoricola sp.]
MARSGTLAQVSSALDNLLNLDPVWLLVIAGLLVFAEDAVFLGFVVPGETAAVIAGVGAGLGHVPLVAAIAVVVVAAIVGDSVGYEVGRVWLGPALDRLRFLDKHRSRIAQAQDFLRRRGGVAVFLGRFTAFFRAMMPALAGASLMSYRRFLAWNAAGGIVWGSAFVSIGYLAGESYHRIESLAGRGLAIGLAVIVVAGLIVWRVRSEKKIDELEDTVDESLGDSPDPNDG